MPFQAGDVIRIWDGTVRPAAHKRFLVICPDAGWLLRINSQPHWRPHWPLSAAANPECLDHDSFLELRGIIEYADTELENAEHLGALCNDDLEDLIEHLPTVETFSEEEIERMVGALEALFD